MNSEINSQAVMSIEKDNIDLPIEKGEWKERAESLFFVDHLGISEVAARVKRARETVSRYISSRVGYEMEMAERKRLSAEKRKEYQRHWDQECRQRHMDVDRESLRREHDTAAYILSREAHF